MIRILLTSDIHGYIFPHSYADDRTYRVGMAAVSTLISKLKDENTILIDNGDILEGSPLCYYHYHFHPEQISPFAYAMNHIGYDFYNLGNHDFDHGQNRLMEHIASLKMPCITSNVSYKGKQLSKDYHILNVDNKKIALFGLTTQYIPNWEEKDKISDLSFTDALDKAKATVKIIQEKEHPDYIICAYHGGLERDPRTHELTEKDTGENEGYMICKEIPEIDILLCGHQHHPMKGKLFNTVFVQNDSNGTQISCVTIDTVNNTITPELIFVDEEADEKLLEPLMEEEKQCQNWLDEPLGTCKINLRVEDDFEARLHKSQVITFLNKAFMEISGADLSSNSLFLNAKGFNSQITMRDLVSTYVFPNTLVVKKINGKALREYLEQNALFWDHHDGKIIIEKSHDFPTPQHFNYDLIDGVEYQIKVSNPVGQKITRLNRNGHPVKDDDEFTICISNYRSAGGGGFEMLKDAETVKEIQRNVVELLAEYITNKKVIDFEPITNIDVVI